MFIVCILSFNSLQNVRFGDTDFCTLQFLSYSFLSMLTVRHGSVVQYTVDFPRTHIWIETGLQLGHLNSEFGRNKCSHLDILQSYVPGEMEFIILFIVHL